MLKHLLDTLIEYGPLGLFLMGILDSVGVPMPAAMDVLLLAYAIKYPNQAWFAALLAVLGSLGGNIVLFRAARMGGSRFVKKDTPEAEQHRFRRWFKRYGLLTVFVPAVVPFVPLPLKVFVVSAGAMHTPTSRFVAVIAAARFLRYFGEAWLGVQLGTHAQDFLQQNSWTILGVLVGIAVLVGVIVKFRGRSNATAA